MSELGSFFKLLSDTFGTSDTSNIIHTTSHRVLYQTLSGRSLRKTYQYCSSRKRCIDDVVSVTQHRTFNGRNFCRRSLRIRVASIFLMRLNLVHTFRPNKGSKVYQP